MRKIVLFSIFLINVLSVNAQTYDISNSDSRKAIVLYQADSQGIFKKSENVSLDVIIDARTPYAYDKKTRELYVENSLGNYVVIVNEGLAKEIKRNKLIPQIKGDELKLKVAEKTEYLNNLFDYKNKIRREEIATAIRKAHEDSLKRVQDSLKRIQDSIFKAKEDSIRYVKQQKVINDYKGSALWYRVPTNKSKLYCEDCEDFVEPADTINCIGINNDTIYWRVYRIGYLDVFYKHIHYAKITYDFQKDSGFDFHYNVFKDSLNYTNKIDNSIAKKRNSDSFNKYIVDLKKKAPNGFFKEWGWDTEYSNITFDFTYMNTNRKTLKYIQVYFALKNDVGDVRKTGVFRGTGPVESGTSGRWTWDHSGYYASGDATKMSLTKVIITYMDGSVVTIPKNKIQIDYRD